MGRRPKAPAVVEEPSTDVAQEQALPPEVQRFLDNATGAQLMEALGHALLRDYLKILHRGMMTAADRAALWRLLSEAGFKVDPDRTQAEVRERLERAVNNLPPLLDAGDGFIDDGSDPLPIQGYERSADA
jgi:hypothetical protein